MFASPTVKTLRTQFCGFSNSQTQIPPHLSVLVELPRRGPAVEQLVAATVVVVRGRRRGAARGRRRGPAAAIVEQRGQASRAASTGSADATSLARSFQVRAHLAIVVRGSSSPSSSTPPDAFDGPTTTGARDLRLAGEATHVCLPPRLIRKMATLSASSVGERFQYAKTLWNTYYAFGSRDGCSVRDSLTNVDTIPTHQ